MQCISWTICKQSASRCRQITTSTPHHSILQTGCSFWHPTNSVEALRAMHIHRRKWRSFVSYLCWLVYAAFCVRNVCYCDNTWIRFVCKYIHFLKPFFLNQFMFIWQQQPSFYGHNTGQCALAPPVKKWQILLVHSFTTCMPLLTATNAFGFGRRRLSSLQQLSTLSSYLYFSLNNRINLRPLTLHIMPCCTHRMAIVCWW